MADGANAFSSINSILKESYSSETNSNPYAKRITKIMNKPNSSKQYFAHIKKYLKKAKT